MMVRSSIAIFRRHGALRRRIHSAAAVLLLSLYAAAVWHGAGHHHEHPAEVHAGCGTHACATDPAPSAGHDAEHDADHTDTHACALCTLLHAPATPGIALAAPPVLPEILAAVHTGTAIVPAALVGTPPSRAPPLLSA